MHGWWSWFAIYWAVGLSALVAESFTDNFREACWHFYDRTNVRLKARRPDRPDLSVAFFSVAVGLITVLAFAIWLPWAVAIAFGFRRAK